MPELLKCKSVLGGFPEDSRIADRGQGECGQSAETARVGTVSVAEPGFFPPAPAHGSSTYKVPRV